MAQSGVLRAAAVAFLVAFGGCDEPLPVAGEPCERLEDCTAGDQLVCANDVCSRVRCTQTVQCPANTFCVDGFCDLAECEDDAECGGGVCYEGDCRDDLCRENAECGITEICAGSPPTCQPPPVLCADDGDCPAQGACVLPYGECTTRCEFDTDCPDNRYCDARGTCRTACTGPDECPEGEVCFGGECVAACEESADACAEELPYRLPSPSCACAECLVDADCIREGEGCLSSGRCTYCPRHATSASECESSGLIFQDGCCTQCIDDVDCSLGLACERGQCVPEDPRECTLDDDCASGEFCDNGFCELSGSLVACATQADCAEGEACYPDGRCRTESSQCGECATGSRCVSGAGDAAGYCAGCSVSCGVEGCLDGELCVLPEGTSEGYCMEAVFSGC